MIILSFHPHFLLSDSKGSTSSFDRKRREYPKFISWCGEGEALLFQVAVFCCEKHYDQRGEARVYLCKGYRPWQWRGAKAGTTAEILEECWALACSIWLAQLCFSCSPGPSRHLGVAMPIVGWDPLHQENVPPDMPTGQSDGGSSTPRFPLPKCVRLTTELTTTRSQGGVQDS